MRNDAQPLWYFGYGSNMCRKTFLGLRQMQPLAVRTARLGGYRLAFDLAIGDGERGVANVVADPAAHVWGVLYQLTSSEFDRLDRTEGVPGGAYDRVPIEVVTADGDRVSAFTYCSGRSRAGRRPSPRYMGLLLTGAREYALPEAYVGYLRGFALAIDEREAAQGTLPLEDTMSRKIKFYFAYNSPFAFLASQRLARELAPVDAAVEYKPVYSPRTGGGAPDLTSPRFKYLFEDVGRFAKAYGLALNPGPFADTKRACLGFFAARALGAERAYHDGVYRARWLAGRDLADDATLADVAVEAGLDRETFLMALGEADHDRAIVQSNAEAEADGVFGFPFFIWEDQRFWGNDRVEWLVRALQEA